uniref:hypothetical protein n=1 Tax=Thelohanellus kitauei TaxID=669202 RepID=UPI003001C019
MSIPSSYLIYLIFISILLFLIFFISLFNCMRSLLFNSNLNSSIFIVGGVTFVIVISIFITICGFTIYWVLILDLLILLFIFYNYLIGVFQISNNSLYLFSFFILFFLSLLCTLIVISQFIYFEIWLLFLLMLKLVLVSILILLVKVSFIRLPIFCYLFTSKVFIFLFFIIFKDSQYKDYILSCVFSHLGFFIIIFFWIVLISISYILLLLKDFEGYFISLLNLSHMLVLITCVFNSKFFLLGFYMDIFICFLVLYILWIGVDFFFNLNLGGNFGTIFVFLLLSHFLGIPPFPSFFLEVIFLNSFLNLSLGGVKVLFILLVYFFLLFQIIIVFNYLSRSINISGSFINIQSNILRVFTIVLGLFICLVWEFYYFSGCF